MSEEVACEKLKRSKLPPLATDPRNGCVCLLHADRPNADHFSPTLLQIVDTPSILLLRTSENSSSEAVWKVLKHGQAASPYAKADLWLSLYQRLSHSHTA